MTVLMTLVLGFMPGVIAEQRNHRHPRIVGCVGFLALWIHPVLWLLAVLWAWKGPVKAAPTATS